MADLRSILAGVTAPRRAHRRDDHHDAAGRITARGRRDPAYPGSRPYLEHHEAPSGPSVCLPETLYLCEDRRYRLVMRWQRYPRRGKRILVTIMACGTWVAGGATAGCSFVLDSKADQCEIDSD